MATIGFDDFEIDLDLFILTHRGEPVDLGTKPLNTLVFLIENRHRVVDREMLRDRVWQGAALSPSAIPTCIMMIRRALGDDPKNPKYIASQRNRGYRFVGSVRGLSTVQRSGNNHTPYRLPFVGRNEEMAHLERTARQVMHTGNGRIVVLFGEAGIGKTRLIEEFCRAHSSSFQVISTRAAPVDGAPPFWTWTQALRVASGDDSLRRSSEAREMSNLIEDLCEAEPASSQDDVSKERRRFEYFRRWTDAILSIPAKQPTLLAVDDVHRLDFDSLLLLYWVADELAGHPMILVASSRHQAHSEDAASLLSEIADLDSASRLEIPPLSLDDIQLFLDPLLENRADLAGQLMSRTGGNAFYLSHLVNFLSSIPDLDLSISGASGLPLHAREIVARQLSDLPGETRDALEVASVLGDQFQLEDLAGTMGVDSDTVPALLSPAIEAGVGFEVAGRFSFNHSILRGSLYRTLEASDRKHAHWLYCQHLLRGTESDTRDSELAHHLAAALPIGSSLLALDFNLLAARRAARRHAHAESKRLFERALEIRRGAREASQMPSVHSIQIDLARQMLFCGDRSGARSLLEDASHLAREANDHHAIATCALNIAPDFLTIEVGANDARLVLLLEEGLEHISSDEPGLRALLLSRLSMALQWIAPPERRLKLADEAIRLATLDGRAPAMIAALSAKIESLNGPSGARERLRYCAELGNEAKKTGDVNQVLLYHTRLITALLETGEIRRVEAENRTYKELANDLQLPQYTWLGVATDCMLATLQGDIELADQLAAQYLKIAGESQDANVVLTHQGQLVARMVERDQIGEMLPAIAAVVEANSIVRFWRAIYCWTEFQAGSRDIALGLLPTFDSNELDILLAEPGGGLGLALIAEVAAEIGSTDERRRLVNVLEPLKNACACAGYGVAYAGSFSRYLALLNRSLGKNRAAIDLFWEAVETERRRGATSWAILAVSDLVETLAINGQEFENAAVIAEELLRESDGLPLVRSRNKLMRALEGAHMPAVDTR